MGPRGRKDERSDIVKRVSFEVFLIWMKEVATVKYQMVED